MEKSIAFFDFDGTITSKDTMLELAKFSAGTLSYFKGMLQLSPWLVAMKAGLISNEKAKEKLLAHFFAGKSLEDFNRLCEDFCRNLLPKLIRSAALAEIQTHLKNNVHVVLVSASAENWLAPWCTEHNLQYLCTRLEVIDKKITGRLLGINCNGDEKVCRIKEAFNLADYSTIYCYGDTGGDKMMLGLATHPYYRKF